MINHAPVGDRVSGISARRTGLDGHGGDGERHESVIATCLHLVEQATDGLLWRLRIQVASITAAVYAGGFRQRRG